MNPWPAHHDGVGGGMVSGGWKAILLIVAAGVLFAPLALIGLTTVTAEAQAQSCHLPPAAAASTVPLTGSPGPSATPGPAAGTSPASPLPASPVPTATATCDDGDGMPDQPGAGIPAGWEPPTNAQQAIAVAYALAQVGKPYVFGATGPDAFDCSGLVQAAWARAGVQLPRVTTDQVHAGAAVPNLAAMEPGDLIFIPGSDGTRTAPGHVGMYIGAAGGRQYLVQAPHTGTVVQVTPVSSWTGEVVAIRRP